MDELRQADDAEIALGFVLNPVDAAERFVPLAELRITFARQHDLQAVRQFRNRRGEVRVGRSQQLKCIVRSGHHSGLELRDSVVLHPGRIGEITRHATDRRGEPRVGVELHLDRSGISLHDS